MMRSFYNYASNQYLREYLNNFVYEEPIWMIFIRVSMSIKIECYMFKTTNEWEGLTSFLIFLIKIFYSFTLLLFNFHANYWQYQIKWNYCTYSYT